MSPRVASGTRLKNKSASFSVRMHLGVGHDMDGFLRWVERDVVRFTPLVQLGLTPLGLCHDGDDAGIVFELA